MFASKQCPQLPKYFEIHGKTFTVQVKTVKTLKDLALKHFVLYGMLRLTDNNRITRIMCFLITYC